MRGSHGLPPSLLSPIGKRFRRQTVPHISTPEACPTRIRKVAVLSAIITRSVMATLAATVIDSSILIAQRGWG